MIKSEVGARAIMDLATVVQRAMGAGRGFKQQLIELLENSKFGGREYTPYEIYMKTLYEYFKDELDGERDQPGTRSAVELGRVSGRCRKQSAAHPGAL